MSQRTKINRCRIHYQSGIDTRPTNWLPFSDAETQASQGKIKSDTLIQTDNDTRWMHAKHIKPLAVLIEKRNAEVRENYKRYFVAIGTELLKWLKIPWRFVKVTVEPIFQTNAPQVWDVPAENVIDGSTCSPATIGKDARTARPVTAGVLYLVRLKYRGIIYSKIGITDSNAEYRYVEHPAEMVVVKEWEICSIETARQIEQAILAQFESWRHAAPASMEGYTETFPLEHESAIRSAAIKFINEWRASWSAVNPISRDLCRSLCFGDREQISSLINQCNSYISLNFSETHSRSRKIRCDVLALNGEQVRVFDIESQLEINVNLRNVLDAWL